MNLRLLLAGAAIFLFQALFFGIYELTTLPVSLILTIIRYSVIAFLNLTAFILVIVGILQEEPASIPIQPHYNWRKA